ncbi:MAG: peptidoglycan-binding domain-containing protein, partial [Bacilli bacterium]|nr:peptidoglycan-binding domain-containing protein [Bacilli bacterium]
LTELMYYQGPTDGIFGSSTNIAVRKFQTNNRLTSDGIVGRNTWSALVYLYSPLAACGNASEEAIDFVGVVIDPGHGGTLYIQQTIYIMIRYLTTIIGTKN